ncbi:hypothetical protein BC835DRAFT_649228 [Cytidiella melzeri]|nr:hypothetical protein BC835DRAFT_649228 [Cytidiella melzeri]
MFNSFNSMVYLHSALICIRQCIMTRLSISARVCSWGTIFVFMFAVTDFRGILAQWFFRKLTHSALIPGFALLCSTCYTKPELPLRLSIWFTAIGISAPSTISLLTYALLRAV